MTQARRVLEHLEKYGRITSLEMFDKFCICCPHGVIRNLRRNFEISDLWCVKKRKELTEHGKERTVSVRYKTYFLKKFEEGLI